MGGGGREYGGINGDEKINIFKNLKKYFFFLKGVSGLIDI